MSDQLPMRMRQDLDARLIERSVIPAAMVESWIIREGLSKQEVMVALLPVAQRYARSPVSRFQVGAVAMGMPVAGIPDDLGNLYLGANFEFLHQALSLVVHGEQSATNNALMHGETGLQFLAVSAPPCGHCRQFLFEISTARDGLTILLEAAGGPGYVAKPVTYFLPDPFEPASLGEKNALMLPCDHGLTLSSPDPIVATALAAANASYAPYSGNYSGVALLGSDGRLFAGRYAENAAYNPGLLPMGSALSQMNLQLAPGQDFDITAACLVEVAAPISQRDATLSALAAVAPRVTLQHIVVAI